MKELLTLERSIAQYQTTDDPNLIQRLQYRLRHINNRGFNFVKTFKSGVSWKRKINYLKMVASARLGLAKSYGQPIHLTIEPTSSCDQKCPLCDTGLGTLLRPSKMMKFETFKKIIDQCDDTLEQIFLYFMGETFLNKDCYRMIRYAADRQIFVDLCTNGNFVKPKELVESGVGEISFQIGGMTQATHEVYRVGGNLEKAMSALEETIRLKKAPDSPNPNMVVSCGFILQKHNEHELKDFLEYCERIGADRAQVFGTLLMKPDEWEKWMPENPKHRRYSVKEYKYNNKLVPVVRPDNHCGWIYTTMSIQVDGSAVPCCRDPKGQYKLGNVLEEGIYKVWNSPKYQQLRSSVSTRSNTLSLCNTCSSYDEAELGRNANMNP